MRKLLTLLAAVSLAVVAFAGPAAAQYGNGVEPSLSTNNPGPGDTFTVGGAGCEPGEDVSVTIGGENVGNTIADEDGNFTVDVVAPSTPGVYELVATCGDHVLSTTITVGAVGTTAAGSTLPRTGGDSLPLASIGAVLVALGGLAVLVTRKRASASV